MQRAVEADNQHHVSLSTLSLKLIKEPKWRLQPRNTVRLDVKYYMGCSKKQPARSYHLYATF
jgi:hypothetical protein